MPASFPNDLLDAWERGQTVSAIERPAALLTASPPADSATDWTQVPVGRRDAELLARRERWFGANLECLANCPQCDATIEFSVRTHDLQMSSEEAPDPITVSHDGLSLSFRLPHTRDLAAVAESHDLTTARRWLFSRCLLSAARSDGTLAAPAEISEETIQLVAERMALADPQADVTFALRCPQCETEWQAPFDAGSFLWQELNVGARRLLQEVHDLATRYGWSESEILALSPARRRAYLELARA